MKKVLSAVVATIMVVMICSCATSKKYITITEPDEIYEYEKYKFDVQPGDILEILEIRTCRNGIEICWKVKKMETGEVGEVKAERMKTMHEVYIIEE